MGKTKKIKNLEGVGLFHPFQNTLYIYCPYILSLICGTNMLQRFNSAVTNLTNTGIVHITCSTTLVLFPAEAAALGQPAIEDKEHQ